MKENTKIHKEKFYFDTPYSKHVKIQNVYVKIFLICSCIHVYNIHVNIHKYIHIHVYGAYTMVLTGIKIFRLKFQINGYYMPA